MAKTRSMLDLWAKLRPKMMLLQEFGEWFSRTVITETPENSKYIDWPCPDRRWFERFLKEEHGLDLDQLERERRAILKEEREKTLQRELRREGKN